MTKHQKTALILAGGALVLYAWYRTRQGLSIFPGFGSSLAGQGTGGSVIPNASFSGSSPNLPAIPVQGMSEDQRIAMRNAATGPLSRGQCLIANGCRWIDTQTAPYYGFGVSQTNFTRWLNSGYNGTSQPTLDYVKRVLGL